MTPSIRHIMLLASSEAAVSPNGENSNSVARFFEEKYSYNIFINQLQNGYYKEHSIRTLYDKRLIAYLLAVLLGTVYR